MWVSPVVCQPLLLQLVSKSKLDRHLVHLLSLPFLPQNTAVCFFYAVIYDNKHLTLQVLLSSNLLTVYVSNTHAGKCLPSVQVVRFFKMKLLALCWLRLCLALITTPLQMKCCRDLHMDRWGRAKKPAAWQNECSWKCSCVCRHNSTEQSQDLTIHNCAAMISTELFILYVRAEFESIDLLNAYKNVTVVGMLTH